MALILAKILGVSLLFWINVFVILRITKYAKYKRQSQDAYKYLLGYSMAEKKYLKKIQELENTKRSTVEIKKEIIQSVLEEAETNLSPVDFPTDQLVNEYKKSYNKLYK